MESHDSYECEVCNKRFTLKSNLTRHMKLHDPKQHACDVCGKSFSTKPQLDLHLKQHQYPRIPMYRQGEARMMCTVAAKAEAGNPNKEVDPTWLDPVKAEAAAKKAGGEMWRGQLVMTFGMYAGQTFRWLLENDAGWAAWILSEFIHQGELNELMKWQKERLQEYVNMFPSVTCLVDRKLKEKTGAAVSSFSQHGSNYASDAELLAVAEQLLDESQVPVSTHITTVGQLTPAAAASQEEPAVPPSQEQPSVSTGIHLEGWQRYWEEPPASAQALGIALPNIKWMKCNEEYGLFERASRYNNAKGDIVERKLLKEKMEFHPPPLPVSVKGAVPSMLSFFTTPAFFWRPVGVMKAMIPCPNTNCPAPPGEYLERKGFGSYARQVCGMSSYYTLLTEKLKCSYCEKVRHVSVARDSEEEEEEDHHQQQYIWLAYSPKVLMSLAPAVRRMFPAILCGKRAIDRGVVTLLSDRLNAVSMSKVQRLLQQGHDEWYVERRDLYQTLLYDAHTLAAGSSSSQRGILSFARAAGTYTPPIAPSPLPSVWVLRRAHLILEMEKMPMYRDQILSTTGEILCIDGTRKILKKIYGDAKGTMQYVTSVLNEWVTAVRCSWRTRLVTG
ncbi:uncharacterized protein LOC121713009 [Alosa sapidissima]|uniref:uncharacterized protein LOC121713009 n=1 Tax=Alosa sapidissima TaxID=34773 RepID=UPI001C090C1B|nr:uncharacterized protein LOC121713009 [Alosa sapidissima]